MKENQILLQNKEARIVLGKFLKININQLNFYFKKSQLSIKYIPKRTKNIKIIDPPV